jgi:hypothetical protein
MAGDDNSTSSSSHLPNDYEGHLREEYEEDGQEQDFCSTVPGTPDIRQWHIQLLQLRWCSTAVPPPINP